MAGETFLSLTRFLGEVKLFAIFSFEEKNLPLGEVKLFAIFSFEEKNLPLGEVKLPLVDFILYLGEKGPPFGNTGMRR